MRATVSLVALLSSALVLSTSLTGTGTGTGVMGGGSASRTGASAPAARALELDSAQVRLLLRGRPGPSPEVDAPGAPSEVLSVVSSEDSLTDALVATFVGLDGVLATTQVRSATLGLFGSVASDGSPRDVPPAGMRIPVNVIAIAPDTYLDVLLVGVDEHDAVLVTGLVPGSVLLSASAARLRGLDAGATMDVGRASALVVAGVVDDGVARGSELLVHRDDVDRIGLGPRESLLVRTAVSASGPTVESLFDAALEGSPDSDVRVWHGNDRVPLVLSMMAVKERFGEFAFRLVLNQREVDIERRFVDEWITIERMPVLGNVRCHRLIMDDLRAAIEDTVAAGLSQWLERDRFGGCFHPRRIAYGRENLSRHAWGIAIDLNVDFSQPGAGPVPPEEFIEIWGRHGFRWGGDFTTPDNHHFEWVGTAAAVRPDRDAVEVRPAG